MLRALLSLPHWCKVAVGIAMMFVVHEKSPVAVTLQGFCVGLVSWREMAFNGVQKFGKQRDLASRNGPLVCFVLADMALWNANSLGKLLLCHTRS